MANGLNLYRVTCTEHRRHGEKHRQEVTAAVVAGETGAEAGRKRLARIESFDPLPGGTHDGIEITAIELGTLRRCLEVPGVPGGRARDPLRL